MVFGTVNVQLVRTANNDNSNHKSTTTKNNDNRRAFVIGTPTRKIPNL